MNIPPTLLYLCIKGERHGFWLLLPLFLIYPLALMVLIVILPFVLIAFLIAWGLGYGKWAVLCLRALWLASLVTCAMRGLKVDVRSRNGLVKLLLI